MTAKRRDPESVIDQLRGLFAKTLARPMLKKGERWNQDWDGWDKDSWKPNSHSVYVLWAKVDDPTSGASVHTSGMLSAS